MLHEALTARADPLHLALVFGLSHTTASKYTLIACDLLADQPAEAGEEQHYIPGEPCEIPELSGVEAVMGAGLAARASISLPRPFLCSAGGDGVGVLTDRFGYCPVLARGLQPASRPSQRPGSCCVLPEDTEDMNRERAETHLRQLAEAELRRARTLPAASIPGRWNSARLAQVAQAPSAVGAVDVGTADEIQADLELAVAVRQPGQPRVLARRNRPRVSSSAATSCVVATAAARAASNEHDAVRGWR